MTPKQCADPKGNDCTDLEAKASKQKPEISEEKKAFLEKVRDEIINSIDRENEEYVEEKLIELWNSALEEAIRRIGDMCKCRHCTKIMIELEKLKRE